ncbi:MAG: hypothetical protein Fur0022_26590 [Anaerolineales bacterium]
MKTKQAETTVLSEMAQKQIVKYGLFLVYNFDTVLTIQALKCPKSDGWGSTPLTYRFFSELSIGFEYDTVVKLKRGVNAYGNDYGTHRKIK